MSFVDKLMFWKKDPLPFSDNQGFSGGNMGMDPGVNTNQDFMQGASAGMPQSAPQQGYSDLSGMNDMSSDNGIMTPQAASRGMPDVSAFRGIGDQASQQSMNQSLYQQGHLDSGRTPFSSAPSAPPVQPQVELPQSDNRELELISAKLDTIKATVESINHRLANLERLAHVDDNQSRNW